MVSMSALCESAAFLAWWTWILVGQKHVADASAARRSVDYGASDAALVANASPCRQATVPRQRELARFTPSVTLRSFTEGTLEIGNLVSLVSAVAIGRQATFEVFSAPFANSVISAAIDQVDAPPLLGGETRSFGARRRVACIEPTKDRPETSIADYRKSVFSMIQGY